MTYVVLAAVAAVVIFIVTGYKVSERKWKMNGKQWLSLAALLIAIPSFLVIVPANNVGVVFSPFMGGVQSAALEEGIKSKGPLDNVSFISTEVQTVTMENLYGQTQDSQYLTISADVKYYVDKTQAVNVFRKFNSLNNVRESLIRPAAQRAIETAMTKYNIIEILGSERTQVYTEIELYLSERFATDGITLHSITFIDTDGGEEIENAIRAEAIAKKAVETAEQERIKAEIQAETRIIQAQAEAREKEILAAAITQNPEILELEWIKKWSGELPNYIGGGSEGIMLDLSDLQDKTTGSAVTPAE